MTAHRNAIFAYAFVIVTTLSLISYCVRVADVVTAPAAPETFRGSENEGPKITPKQWQAMIKQVDPEDVEPYAR